MIDDDVLNQPISPYLQKKIDKLIADEASQQQRTWSYYEKLRKDNPDKFWTGKIQDQMVRDASALGENFQDGGFND